jgi:hypothetical protein
MKLFHSKCKSPVEASTTKVGVRVAEFAYQDGSLVDVVLDLVPVRTGRVSFHCPACKKDVDPDELLTGCVYCLRPVPIDEVYQFGSDYPVLCKRCYTKLWIERYGASSDGITYSPITLRFK